MDYRRAADTLARHKWILVVSVLVTVVLTYGVSRMLGSQWVATVTLISPSSPAIANPTSEPNSPDWVTEGRDFKALEAMYTTVVTSREVVEPALVRLGLRLKPSDVAHKIGFDATGERLFALTVTDSESDRAQKLANALADNFVERNHRLYTERNRRVVTMLRDQLRDAEAALQTAKQRQTAYATRHHIVGALTDALKSAQEDLELARQRRDSAREEYGSATARLAQKSAELQRLPPPTGQTTGDEAVRVKAQEEELARAQKKLDELRARYTDTHQEVVAAQTARDRVQTKLEEARRQQAEAVARDANGQAYATLSAEISQIRQEIAGLQGQLEAQDATVRRSEEQVQLLKGKEGGYSSLASEVISKTEARAGIVTRLNGARMALDAAERQNPVVVMERSDAFNPPVNKSSGRTRKLLLLAAISALILTSGAILAFEGTDRRVRSVRQAELSLPGKVLAAIPQPLGPVTYSGLARATELHPQSLHSEQYRFLGLQLLNTPEPRPRSLMVLATKAEQGSTTTITNLGITLAQAGQRVIIVDANTRTAELHQVFDVPNEYGFTDLLRDPSDASLDKAMRPTSVPNLSIVTVGSTVRNPWELFRSDNLKEVSRQLHGVADFVLYDTPSATMFTDALNLAPIVDAAFLCLRALEPMTGAEHRMIEMIEQADVRVLGSVLNDVPASVVEGYDNYRHYYAPQADTGGSGKNGTAVAARPTGLIEDRQQS